ncbi:FAD/NAD(P)-binding domain-containing protein [Paxillus ammoniavirescens]|nr:FAD/NAD(P)-binding domain-containing protein [Paxillus ammoniavirescens]
MFDIRQFVFSLTAYVLLRQWPLGPNVHQHVHQHGGPKLVAIVGGGSAGLAMLKTLVDFPDETFADWDIVLYEQREDVGGIWLPDPDPPSPPHLPETPLYPLLRTNTPVPTMTYPGFPFRPNTPLYPRHQYVEQYHQDVASHFNLRPYIMLEHTTVSASWSGTPAAGHWDLRILDSDGQEIRKSFDHLIVASGHNHYPHIPTFAGQEEWLRNSPIGGQQREILHSMWYRGPERFAGRTVVIVGAGASGLDAVRQVGSVAAKVYQSVRQQSEIASDLVEAKPGISKFTAEGVVFSDGSVASDVDSVILATGYELLFPFLQAGGVVEVRPEAHRLDGDNLITNLRYLFPLHQHIFSLSPSYPVNALAFIGLPELVQNCPSDTAQSIFAAHVIANPRLLASREELLQQLKDSEDTRQSGGTDPYSVGHTMLGNSNFDYQDYLIDYLKERGALPNDGRKFVEGWRRDARGYNYLKRGWNRVEELGEERKWLREVETEEEWADLMKRLDKWQEEWETQQGLVFPDEEFIF